MFSNCAVILHAIHKLRQVQWVGDLQCFNFEIEYQTGKSNTNDALSQRPDYGEAAEEDALVQVFPSDAEVQTSFTSELEMLLLKNSMVHVVKLADLNDAWT